MILTELLRSFLTDRLSKIGIAISSVSAGLLLIMLLAIRFQLIDIVELGLSDGIDGIGKQLAPVYLVFCLLAASSSIGVLIVFYAQFRPRSNRAIQNGDRKANSAAS